MWEELKINTINIFTMKLKFLLFDSFYRIIKKKL